MKLFVVVSALAILIALLVYFVIKLIKYIIHTWCEIF